MSKFGVFIISTIFGVILWWVLCFIPAVEHVDNLTHEKVSTWVNAPTDTPTENSGAETPQPSEESATPDENIIEEVE